MKTWLVFPVAAVLLFAVACGRDTLEDSIEESGAGMEKVSQSAIDIQESGQEEVTIAIAEGEEGMEYDFSEFSNVELIGIDTGTLKQDELSILYQQARYCQAMTEADTDTMRELVSEDTTFTHMSGRQQTREEYFADVENGSLRYFTIGIENPSVKVDGDYASITYTSVLNANAYGARGTYRMGGTHWYENRNGSWVQINAPENK